MELRDFECFVAVAEELHFGRAAQRLAMAQPPLSLRIKALEEELGTRLFARTSRQVALTPAGRVFWERAKAMLELAAAAGDEVRRVGLGLAGKLTVGFVNPAMDAFLAQALARFREAAPEVELSLREMTTREQAVALAGERLDVGFCRFTGQTLPGAAIEVVSREPYILALPAGHALAGSTPLPLAALNGQPLIVPPRTGLPALARAMADAFAAAGATPVPVQEAVSKFTMLGLVAAGVGLALLPASARIWQRAAVVWRELEPGLPLVELAAITPAGRASPAATRLVEECQECLRRPGGIIPPGPP
ncbi:LysR family transcriptional regulator [Desulfovibrio aerotolerans]|uniref:LysR family transcriptional regulator n=1 Tax=Solidesulfovibrio aerotolerans TaxID=295255 RepID=A0A7C9MJR2_9BACT|nr:LysR substrate-binding domain-containing protein [Solidesulfovibrio aerotolerans]MYL84108.1 LysR family transcriptional regulator [Solidesulfovibrio aerotolerans]